VDIKKAVQRLRRRWPPRGRPPSRATPPHHHLHNAVDDHCRLAYTEILANERKETAVAFWRNAQKFFTTNGITVQRVLTDNGSCYKSLLWRDALAEGSVT
jgi:hypothetical protein